MYDVACAMHQTLPSTGSVMTKATVLAYRFLMASITQGRADIARHVIRHPMTFEPSCNESHGIL